MIYLRPGYGSYVWWVVNCTLASDEHICLTERVPMSALPSENMPGHANPAYFRLSHQEDDMEGRTDPFFTYPVVIEDCDSDILATLEEELRTVAEIMHPTHRIDVSVDVVLDYPPPSSRHRKWGNDGFAVVGMSLPGHEPPPLPENTRVLVDSLHPQASVLHAPFWRVELYVYAYHHHLELRVPRTTSRHEEVSNTLRNAIAPALAEFYPV